MALSSAGFWTTSKRQRLQEHRRWESFVKRSGYAVTVVGDPGRGRLSRDEIDKLAEVSGRYREKDHWEKSDLTHEFPEWVKNFTSGAVALIPLEDILDAQGEQESQATLEIIKEGESVRQHMNKIFGPTKTRKPPEPLESVQ